MTKHVFVTGGVVSGLGKGITAASSAVSPASSVSTPSSASASFCSFSFFASNFRLASSMISLKSCRRLPNSVSVSSVLP